jgi:geranylgeranyl pyrophosphate synthase
MNCADASGFFAMQNMVRNCIAACAKQHMDATLALREASTTAEALSMTELKAGGCGRLAASFGAELATQDEELRRLFSDLGFNIFVYLQLLGDLRDAYPAEGVPADLLQGKKTVPLAYFHSAASDRRAIGSDSIMLRDDNDCGYRREFDDGGANTFGAVVAEAYLNQAKVNMADLSAQLGSLDRLERLIESLEIDPQDIPSAQ